MTKGKMISCCRCIRIPRNRPATKWNGYGHGFCDECAMLHDAEEMARFKDFTNIMVDFKAAVARDEALNKF